MYTVCLTTLRLICTPYFMTFYRHRRERKATNERTTEILHTVGRSCKRESRECGIVRGNFIYIRKVMMYRSVQSSEKRVLINLYWKMY